MCFGVLHRRLFVCSLATILYGGASAIASEAAPAADRTEPATIVPHIALLLPAGSSAFARAAEAVKLGFLTAAKTQGKTPLPIRSYAVSDDRQNIVAGYSQALAAGARVVVGPLTRDGVSALAASNLVRVPTLALNVPDGVVPLPPDLYVLSLHVEAEARQVAQLAIKDGRLNALTINGDTPLLRRIHQAFVEEFTRLGGQQIAEYEFTTDPARLARIRQAVGLRIADMAFLALDFQRARLARPYLDPLPLYATSQIFPGNTGLLAGFDLDNIRFVDMPWLLQPDHPAVMVYPRQEFHDAVDLERLYALGIDAFRIVQALLEGKSAIALDGVTGRLTLGRDQQFTRAITSAQFADGKLLIFADTQ
jgi:outer membrane PBP1 activator LpoA protein